MNKSFGFSREEFSLLCNVYNIMELVCFEQKEGSVAENRTVDEIYHQTLFQLCRKEYINVEGSDFRVSEEIKGIFSVLKNSDLVVTTFCREEDVPGFCLYFSKNTGVVVMREGSRAGEYVKVELLKKGEAAEFIKTSGMLMMESMGTELSAECEVYEVVGVQLEEFLQWGDLETADSLRDIPEIVTLFKLQNPATALKTGYIALVKQPMQDKILVVDAEGIRHFAYSEHMVMELFQEMWEEENDIG